MNPAQLQQWKDKYYRELTENIVPFWQRHSVDWEYGGFMDFLDRTGRPLSTDKGGWVQGRAIWVFSALYREIAAKTDWYQIAENGVHFLRNHLQRKSDGRIYFEVTRKGRPLVMRRYVFCELFATLGLAAWAEISGEPKGLQARKALQEAKKLMLLASQLAENPPLPAKIDPNTRALRSHAAAMIPINVLQNLRRADPQNAAQYSAQIERQIEQIFRYFVKPQHKALLETVGIDGEIAEGCEGRCVNPGHSIETAWFLMDEAEYRNDPEWLKNALTILDWSLALGWDSEYGGLFSFIDIEGRQPAQLEWDMKYWWPHCEALIACIQAYDLSGKPQYLEWFEKIHNYTWARFPDREYGEWFGYLRRDGSVQLDLKGNHFKGPFHIPRCLLAVYQRLARILAKAEER